MADVLANTWDTIIDAVAGWLPSFAAALLLLLAGWVVGRIAQAVVRTLLRRLGLDRLSERAGIADALNRIGVESAISALLGRLVYWLIFLFFLMAAMESVGLEIVSEALNLFVAYLPNVLVAIVLLLLGSGLARVAGDTVRAFAVQSDMRSGVLLANIVRYTLLAVTGILALDQLNVRTTLLAWLMLILVAALAFATALAFGLGNRDSARSIMAGFHAKEVFVPGQSLHVNGIKGRLVRIGTVTSMLETVEGMVSLPNDDLIAHAVVIDPGVSSEEAGEGKTDT